MAAFSVTDTENIAEKRRRGRPKAWHSDDTFASYVAGLFPEDRSVRARENRRLALTAHGSLVRSWHPSFAWFWSLTPRPYDGDGGVNESVMRGTGSRLRWTVLTELGRFNDADRLDVAMQLAALPLSTRTRAAVAMCRRARLGDRRKPASCVDLTNAIASVIDAYRALHPDTTHDQILMALHNVLDACVAFVTTEAAE